MTGGRWGYPAPVAPGLSILPAPAERRRGGQGAAEEVDNIPEGPAGVLATRPLPLQRHPSRLRPAPPQRQCRLLRRLHLAVVSPSTQGCCGCAGDPHRLRAHPPLLSLQAGGQGGQRGRLCLQSGGSAGGLRGQVQGAEQGELPLDGLQWPRHESPARQRECCPPLGDKILPGDDAKEGFFCPGSENEMKW